jgi:GNAT superfamily N-acetyltransferase
LTRRVTPGAVRVTDGRAEDAQRLSDLALRSTGHWGYDAAFLEACRAELTLTPEQAATARVVRDGHDLLGFHLLEEGELAMLFVEPAAMGRGVGRALLADAQQAAAGRGWTRMRIASDPGAEGFYLAHGAQRLGVVPSGSVPGRELPLLELPVRPVW